MSATSATSSNTETSLVYNDQDPKASLISVNMTNITKLASSNYLTWQIQVRALLEAHELHVFLDGTAVPPATVLSGKDMVPNPLFVVWKRQDRMIYSALIGTLSLSTQPIVARATTSREIWQILANTFARPSREHIKHLRSQIMNSSKGSQSITEYMRNILMRSDHLALLGSPLPHEDLLDAIIGGLGDDYRAIKEMVTGRDTPITTDELHEKLIGRENTLSSLAESPNNSFPATANNAQYSNRGGSYQQRGGFNSSRGGNQQTRGGHKNSRPYLGKCQFCEEQGHTAKKCPLLARAPAPPTPQNNAYWLPLPRNNNAQWSGPPPPMPPSQWAHQAHYTATSPSEAGSWLLDSGASHHIASDLSNLSLHAPYQGGEDVIIGNGAGLNITHTGSSLLPSSSRPLSLTNVLCVPAMKKNLISVNKLCRTNNVMVQMYPYTFQVKDLSTGATLLNGKASDGVYEWPVTPLSSISAFPCIKISPSTWHSRLGHPSPPILRQLASEFSLPMSSNSIKTSLLCNSCSINKSHKLPFSTTSICSTHPLEIIFSDVWTAPVFSSDGFKYYVIFVDHYTRYIWFYPLAQKSQVGKIFPLFQALVENRFNMRIKTLSSDNGGEFIGLRTHHLTTPPHTPEHNGIAERRHRHIVETGMALLTHASIPSPHWTYAFSTAVYLINRMPTSTLGKSSPFHLLFGTAPNCNHTSIFGRKKNKNVSNILWEEKTTFAIKRKKFIV